MSKTKGNFKIDRISFKLGMINCFAEMVACGVKKLALSPPLSPNDYETIRKYSDKIVEEFDINFFIEEDLLITDLQSEDFTRGKCSILYFKDPEILDEYLALKEKKREMEQKGHYDEHARKKISRKFMRLLSYPEEKIKEKLSQKSPESPFMLISD